MKTKTNYLLIIILSLSIALSNFTSTQLAAMRMFTPIKLIKPEVLMFLLVEAANCQKAQQVCQWVSKKEIEDNHKALIAGADSSLRF